MTELTNGVVDSVHYDKSKEALSVTQNTNTELSSLIVPEEQVIKWYQAAVAFSWASVIFPLFTGFTAIGLGVVGDNESMFAYGLDAILDSLSSMAVVWRFYGSADSVYSTAKERRACIVIGFLFLVSATSLIVKSAYNILTNIHESKNYVLFVTFAVVCGVISVVLSVAKIYLGYKLNSRALATDSVITLVGAASCFATVIGLLLYINDGHLWFLDSVFGIACGIFLLFFGIRLLYTMYKEKDYAS